jgi:hypothetical protein
MIACLGIFFNIPHKANIQFKKVRLKLSEQI